MQRSYWLQHKIRKKTLSGKAWQGLQCGQSSVPGLGSIGPEKQNSSSTALLTQAISTPELLSLAYNQNCAPDSLHEQSESMVSWSCSGCNHQLCSLYVPSIKTTSALLVRGLLYKMHPSSTAWAAPCSAISWCSLRASPHWSIPEGTVRGSFTPSHTNRTGSAPTQRDNVRTKTVSHLSTH